jgi:hypothetical protein
LIDTEDEYPEMALVRFDEWIKTKGRKERVMAAEYTGTNCFGKVWKVLLVSNNGSAVPEWNKQYLVFLPKKHYYSNIYYNAVSVFRVKVIMPETVGEIKVFNNIFIPAPLFKNFNGSKTMVIIRDPDLEGEHKTSLLRIITNNGNEEIVKRFVKKNLLLEDIKVKKSGIIEAVTEESEDPDFLKNDFLKLLSDFVSELSEA